MGHFCVRAPYSKVVPAGNYSGLGCGGYLLLKAFKTARLPAWTSTTYTEPGLISGFLYCAHGNTLALKLRIRSFPALFSTNIGKLSLVLHLSGTGLTSRQTGRRLSTVSSRRGDSKSPQPSDLWRQPQERELSVTGVTTALRAVNSSRSPAESLCIQPPKEDMKLQICQGT